METWPRWLITLELMKTTASCSVTRVGAVSGPTKGDLPVHCSFADLTHSDWVWIVTAASG